MAEIGDFKRFQNPQQLMSYLGLVPSEHSSGEKTRRGSITKAGNTHVHRMRVEAAWAYRLVSRALLQRQEGLPQSIRDMAWSAPVRLCARYRRLGARGKIKTVVTTAIARELCGFIWAIATAVEGPTT